MVYTVYLIHHHHVFRYIYIYTYLFVYIYVYIYIYIYTRIYIYLHIHGINLHTYEHTGTYIHIFIYIHTYEIALFSFLDRVSIYLCASMFTCVMQVSHTRMNILLLHNIIFNGHIMLADKMVNSGRLMEISWKN